MMSATFLMAACCCCCDTWHPFDSFVTTATLREGYHYYTSHYEDYDEPGTYYPIVPDPLADSDWAAVHAVTLACTPWPEMNPTAYHVGHKYNVYGPTWPPPWMMDPVLSYLDGYLFTIQSYVDFTMNFDPTTEEAHSIVMRLTYTHSGPAFDVEVLVDGSPVDTWTVDGDGTRDVEVAQYGATYINFVIKPASDPAYPGSTGSPPVGNDFEAGMAFTNAEIKYQVRDK